MDRRRSGLLPGGETPPDRGVRTGWRAVTVELLEELARTVWPAPCLACDAVEPPLARNLGLCPRCADRLEPLGPDRCPSCARPLAANRPAGPVPRPCLACRRRRLPYERLVVGWPFVDPVATVIHALKFGRQPFLGRQIAARLAPRVPAVGLDAVVPVPLHWRRRLERGYNQAEEIARPLARRLGLPMRRLLRRPRSTPPQARLPRAERVVNLRRAFRASRGAAAFRRVLLVDDVITTGSTLRGAAGALRSAGVERVVALAAARTPGPDERRQAGPTPPRGRHPE